MGFEKATPFVMVQNEIFGQKPNKHNLKDFFANEVIQALWWGPPDKKVGNTKKKGFVNSQKLRKLF